jgi:hypothetical protein
MSDAAISAGVRRWIVREIAGTAVAGALLVVASGRWNWAMAWALVGVFALAFIVQLALLLPRSPGLLAERASRMGRTRDGGAVEKPHFGAKARPDAEMVVRNCRSSVTCSGDFQSVFDRKEAARHFFNSPTVTYYEVMSRCDRES